MTRTSVPGNRSDGGFILLDALLCLFLVSLLALAVQETAAPIQKLSVHAAARGALLIEERNRQAAQPGNQHPGGRHDG
jgi:Tfp pilus assembly protein PilX